MSENQNRVKELTTRLRKQGHRVTPQRIAIIETLIGNSEHLNAEEVHERIKKDFSMISLATVYKTVNLLKKIGEIVELGFCEGCNRYQDNNLPPHPHLICTMCGTILDLEVSQFTEISQEVAQTTRYEIIKHRLDFFGICPFCQE